MFTHCFYYLREDLEGDKLVDLGKSNEKVVIGYKRFSDSTVGRVYTIILRFAHFIGSEVNAEDEECDV
jgi:hypothetical protein